MRHAFTFPIWWLALGACRVAPWLWPVQALVRRGLWLGALALASLAAHAQHHSFRHFAEEDGLINLATRCLGQDDEGFLWACTENGLFRSEGRRFERFATAQGLRDADIRSLAFGAAGQMWVGTVSGLHQRVGDRFEAIEPGGRRFGFSRAGQQIAVVSPQAVYAIERGQLWRVWRDADGRWSSAPVFDAGQLEVEPSLQALTMVFLDREGTLWLGCGEALCESRVDANGGRSLRRWGVVSGVPSMGWRTALIDRGGRLWVRGTKGLVVREPGAERFESRDPPHAALTSSDTIVPLVEDSQGRIVTRNEDGLAVWSAGHWRTVSARNGLAPTVVIALLADRDGALWVGHMGRGVSRWLGYGQWEAWTAGQGIDREAVWSVGRLRDGSVMFNTSAGCRRLRPQAVMAEGCGLSELPSGQLFGMATLADGSLVVGQRRRAIYRIAADGRSAQQLALMPSFLHLMTAPDGESVWVTTASGPYQLRREAPDSDRWEASNPSGLETSIIDLAAGPDGRMWFIDHEGQLLERRTDGVWRVHQPLVTHEQHGADALAVAPDGTVWINTSAGVGRVVWEGDRAVRMEMLHEPLLQEVSTMFMRFDRRGWLWLGTDRGVLVHDGQRWRQLDRTDGLVWNDTNSGAFFEDTDGSIWIGTAAGAAHLLHPERLRERAELSARILSARYGDQQLVVPEGAAAAPLHWGSDTAFDVRLAAMRPAQAWGAVFRYRLVGLTDTWFETSNPDLHTPALPPGRYQLEVIARRPTSGLESPPAVLAFEVLAPWWRTLWFQALAALTLAGWAVGGWRVGAGVMQRRRQRLAALVERATRDPLTGLWNRATILDTLGREIARAHSARTSLAVAMIDIDHFKRVNDTLGHLAGDEVLRRLGQHLSANVRHGDALGRYGGEELILVMPGLPEVQPSQGVERLLLRVAQTPIVYEGRTISITASIGVSWLDPGCTDAQALIGRADAALYAAKSAGRNRVAYANADAAAHAHAHAQSHADAAVGSPAPQAATPVETWSEPAVGR